MGSTIPLFWGSRRSERHAWASKVGGVHRRADEKMEEREEGIFIEHLEEHDCLRR